MKLQPEYLNLEELFDERLFRIPDYQRHYSWKSKQRDDLFADIDKLMRNERKEHFMSTVVCLNANERDKEKIAGTTYTITDIVDGQQRITTLIIILKALSQKLKESRSSKGKSLSVKLTKLLVKQNERQILLPVSYTHLTLPTKRIV